MDILLNDKQTSVLISFFILCKSRFRVIRNLQKEINFLKNLTYQIIERIKTSHIENIINQNEYKIYMDLINDCIIKIDSLPDKIVLSTFKELSRYKIMLGIAEIKLKFINIVQKIGSKSVFDITKLILNIDNLSVNLSTKYIELLLFYSKVFN